MSLRECRLAAPCLCRWGAGRLLGGHRVFTATGCSHDERVHVADKEALAAGGLYLAGTMVVVIKGASGLAWLRLVVLGQLVMKGLAGGTSPPNPASALSAESLREGSLTTTSQRNGTAWR
jgi:hypothetical protein